MPDRSVPAGELDKFVLDKVRNAFKSPEIIQELVHQIKPHKPEYGVREIFDIVQSVEKVFEHFEPATLQSIVSQIIEKVIVHKDKVVIRFKPFGISLLEDHIKVKNKGFNHKTLEFTYNVTLARKRGRIKIINNLPSEMPERDERLINAVSQAFKWQDLLDRTNLTIAELARREKEDRTHMGRILKLCYLSPEIITAIMEGRQPRLLNLQTFTRGQIPLLWSDQLRKYGFTHDSM